MVEIVPSPEIQWPAWVPEVPVWNPEKSDKSPGAIARGIWEEKFADLAGKKDINAQVIFTGIGGGAAKGGEEDKKGLVWVYRDRAEVPEYVDLEKSLGKVPEVLFLVASAKSTDNILGLRGLARTYKEKYGKAGLKHIVVILTALAHERQDHEFKDEEGNLIKQVITLQDAIEILSGEGYIDGGVLLQPHSFESIEIANKLNFPLIPIDTFLFSVKNSGFEQLPKNKLLIMGPDKGRKNVAKRLAAYLGVLYASAIKMRARLDDGYPTMSINPQVLEYIRENDCIVGTGDDEIREGGTLFTLLGALTGFAIGVRFWALKAIMAGEAVDYCRHPLLDEVIISDAVEPVQSIRPISDLGKLTIVSLMPQLRKLAGYLKKNFVRPGDEKWLTAETSGTLLELDYGVE